MRSERGVMEQRLEWTMVHFRAKVGWNCGKRSDEEVIH